MKFTKRQIKQIIQEEIQGLLDENRPIGSERVVGSKTRTYDTKTGKMTKCVAKGDMKCPPVKKESIEENLDESSDIGPEGRKRVSLPPFRWKPTKSFPKVSYNTVFSPTTGLRSLIKNMIRGARRNPRDVADFIHDIVSGEMEGAMIDKKVAQSAGERRGQQAAELGSNLMRRKKYSHALPKLTRDEKPRMAPRTMAGELIGQSIAEGKNKMKFTKQQLKQIIKEEITAVLMERDTSKKHIKDAWNVGSNIPSISKLSKTKLARAMGGPASLALLAVDSIANIGKPHPKVWRDEEGNLHSLDPRQLSPEQRRTMAKEKQRLRKQRPHKRAALAAAEKQDEIDAKESPYIWGTGRTVRGLPKRQIDPVTGKPESAQQWRSRLLQQTRKRLKSKYGRAGGLRRQRRLGEDRKKFTKQQLKQIIEEEIQKLLNEQDSKLPFPINPDARSSLSSDYTRGGLDFKAATDYYNMQQNEPDKFTDMVADRTKDSLMLGVDTPFDHNLPDPRKYEPGHIIINPDTGEEIENPYAVDLGDAMRNRNQEWKQRLSDPDDPLELNISTYNKKWWGLQALDKHGQPKGYTKAGAGLVLGDVPEWDEGSTKSLEKALSILDKSNMPKGYRPTITLGDTELTREDIIKLMGRERYLNYTKRRPGRRRYRRLR